MAIVAKFGGTSMADAGSIRRVAEILKQNKERRVAVVSAPGVSREYANKVTDLLYANEMQAVRSRFKETMCSLAINPEPLSRMCDWAAQAPVEYRVAFGEYMSAYILAKFLGWRFVDARLVFTLNQYGDCMYTRPVWKIDERVVVPGFYGAAYGRGITLFPRGGSDISGSLIAEAVGATMYENWTDVSGIYTSDPRKNVHAKHLPRLSYRQAMMLCATGATVFHQAAIKPVARAGIKVHIRNTFSPDSHRTIIG